MGEFLGGAWEVGQQLDHAVASKSSSRCYDLSRGQEEDTDGLVVGLWR